MLRQLACLMVSFICTGCTSMGRADTKIEAPDKNQSIFVIGLTPENHRIGVFGGSEKDGKFKQNWLPAVLYGGAQGGYIVGKAHAGATLAITAVQVTENEKSFVGTDFQACNGAKTVVFQVPPGKVIYLGSVDYRVNGKSLEVRYWNDLDGAHRYLSGAYPAIADRVEQGSYRLLPTDLTCEQNTTVYVPVYIPTSR